MIRSTIFAATCSLLLAAFLPNTTAEETAARRSNRLAQESSPYLLLHAHNPVDWYPWGQEAFEKARKENKLVFLSVGYSSCYWCHVMEREVFSDEDIAKYMNEHFVNIKVDREERPDVDDIYMTSLLVYNQMAGSKKGGGWPLSMFLTPDGSPVAGATYLPPKDSPERGPGFPGVAKRLAGLWKEREADLKQTAMAIAAHVQRLTRPGADLQKTELNGELINETVAAVKELYDPVWGGVDFNAQNPNNARFPNVPRMEVALDVFESTGDKELLKIVEHSLTSMARGGIRDHLGGGFHRYSTDRRWHVPHFEKMLYDQAMLLGIYARAAKTTGNAEFRTVAEEIAEFIQREMTTDKGAFCSALDAETNAIEGEYYVWSKEQISKILGDEDAKVLNEVYGVNTPNPFEHGYVLHLPKSLNETAKVISRKPEDLQQQLEALKSKLLTVRSKRDRPLLDDKVLTSWNALMIRALAFSGRELNRDADTAAAVTAADFLLNNLRTKDGRLLRTWRNGKAKYPAYLDDYAFLVDALLEIHKTTGQEKWLSRAEELALIQNELFYDESLQAFYFTATDHEKLIARTCSAYDSVFPSANSVSVCNLLQLSELKKAPALKKIATSTLTRFATTMHRSPSGCSGMARALHMWLQLSENSDRPVGFRIRQPSYLLTQADSVDAKSSDDKESNAEKATDEKTVPGDQFLFKAVFRDETSGVDRQNAKEKPLKVKVYPYYNKLPRGGKCLVAIELQIQRGWHINANPANPDFLVPTKVEVKTKQKVKLSKLKYPKHHELEVDGFDDPYHVYDGKVIVYGLLEIDNAETADFAQLEFLVSFQGCNSKECLPPDKVRLPGKIAIAKKGEKLEKKNQTKFPKLKKDAAGPGKEK